jgi:hypothetical protein
MKAWIKIIVGIILFLAFIGTAGALEVGNIGILHALIQSGACFLGMYLLMRFGGKCHD